MNLDGNTRRNAEIIRRRKAKEGPRAIARAMKLSPSVVSGVLHRAGLANELKGRGAGVPSKTKRMIIDYADEYTLDAAANAFGYNRTTIQKWRKASRSKEASR